MGRQRLIATALAAASLAGCGPTAPQAPGAAAHQLNEIQSAFSSACGHAYEIEAFTRDPRELAIQERQASSQIPALARIHRRGSGWYFQGKTVSQIVRLSSAYLDACGLHRSARRLREAT